MPLRQNEDEMWWPMNDTDLGDKAGGQYKDFATYGVIASEHVLSPGIVLASLHSRTLHSLLLDSYRRQLA